MKKLRVQKQNKPRGSVERSMIGNIGEPVEGTVPTHPLSYNSVSLHRGSRSPCCRICPIAKNARRLARANELLWEGIQASHKGTL